jgi:CHAT domain-containing protein
MLNADCLSACNIAAGDRPGTEAPSGLARAFFYAGARALLVSHWQLDSESAARLTTSTFDALKKNPAIGRAEALRRGHADHDRGNAYPDYGGPFSIVGEDGSTMTTREGPTAGRLARSSPSSRTAAGCAWRT